MAKQQFVSTYISTIGIDYGSKRVSLPATAAGAAPSTGAGGTQEIKVHFWDASGDANWRDVRTEFMQDAHAVCSFAFLDDGRADQWTDTEKIR